MLTIRLHLVPSLRMHAAIPQLPLVSPWYISWFNPGLTSLIRYDTLNIPLYQCVIYHRYSE